MEVEVSTTFTGQGQHAFFLPSQWEEYLDFDTQRHGVGWPMRRVLSSAECQYCGITGVSNLFEAHSPTTPPGSKPTWTVGVLEGANTYGFGRLSYGGAKADASAQEWASLTWAGDQVAISATATILGASQDAFENYTSPLGLGYIVDVPQHYWMDPVGWHGLTCPPNNGFGGGFNATNVSIGNGRSISYGTTYGKPWADVLASPERTPRNLLLTFHHLAYAAPLPNTGRPLIQAIYDAQECGLAASRAFSDAWATVKGHVDAAHFESVRAQLAAGEADAVQFADTVRRFLMGLSGIKPDGKQDLASCKFPIKALAM